MKSLTQKSSLFFNTFKFTPTQQRMLITSQSKSFSQIFANRVLMVEPTNFFLNEETFADNKFMNKVQEDQAASTKKAKQEFSNFVTNLKNSGVEVTLYKQQAPNLPDSVFPNNWFSTHRGDDIPGGLFVLYPMKTPSREGEKNPALIKEIGANYSNFHEVKRHNSEQALEGTGSLLFDVENKKIYCELSIRADETLLNEFTAKYNSLSKTPYKLVKWRSVDPNNNPVYHTNVVMAILKDHTILATESISNKQDRERVIEEITSPKLNKKPKQLIDINFSEMLNMAGNMIMVQNKQGEHCVIMSERARKGLREHNLKTLEKHYRIISADLQMIEHIGGGSARCMVAELF